MADSRRSTVDGFAAFVMRARARGVTDHHVLNAFEATQRERYVDPDDRERMFTDQVLPLPCGQACERLDDLALAIAGLDIEPHHRILDVGTGGGFAAAVMARLGARVVTIDRYRTLLRLAGERHARSGISTIEYRLGDGRTPPTDGPFDRVLFSVALDEPPRGYIEALAPGGVVVAPVGEGTDVDVLRLARVGLRYERRRLGSGLFASAERGVARVL